jgi:hypothetical protein
MGVDLRRLEIRVPEELLQRADRDARRRELRREGVAQVVEADHWDVGALARGLEPAGDLGAIQGRAELRMREHQIVAMVEQRATAPALELRPQALGHGNGSTCAEVRLASPDCSPRTTALRTRIRCDSKSTFFQRSPISSTGRGL